MTRRSYPCLYGVLAFCTIAVASPCAARASETVRVVVVESPPPMQDPAGGQWSSGVPVSLAHELKYRKPNAAEQTDVVILADKTYLYVAFAAKQSVGVTDAQEANDASWGTDDGVGVVLWPGGPSGFQYFFESNPSGTHYESSSENGAFEPNWTSVGERTPSGYRVRLAIPLAVLKGDGRDAWQLQLYRRIAATGEMFVWNYDPAQRSPGNPQFAGALTGMSAVTAAAVRRTPLRAAVYGLAQVQPASLGGSTSRIGGDFSYSLGKTISAFGTVHPDYSNVEIDQQSIAPTEFQRQYVEVRPFFTQGQSLYNPSGSTDLYTPAIPTPSWGLAYEGTSGLFQSAAFDARSDDRDDNAVVMGYTSPNGFLSLGFQRVQASIPGLEDVVTTENVSYGNQRSFTVFGSFGTDAGTNAPAGMNRDVNFGASLFGPKSNVSVNYVASGLYFDPVDGYVAHTDVKGLSYYASRELDFSPSSRIVRLNLTASFDQYRDHLGAVDQQDAFASLSATTRRNLTASWSAGSNNLLETGYGLTPFTQQGPSLYFAPNAALPSYAGLRYGHYYDGFLHSVYGGSTLALGRSSRTLSLGFYRTDYAAPFHVAATQTLLHAAVNLQFSTTGIFSIGWRTIAGSAPAFVPLPYARDDNLSLGLTERTRLGDLYVAYGDPNAVSTAPSLIVKLVRFVSGEKGT